MHQKAIIIFLKYPKPGAVKTRLAHAIGIQSAARIADQLIKKTFLTIRSVCEQTHFNCFIAIENSIATRREYEQYINKHLNLDVIALEQQGHTLGDRIYNAVDEVLDTHKHCIVIGTDCPDISPGHLIAAHHTLQDHDLVVGPAHDGGYYLIGMKRKIPHLFSKINWSTSTVLKETQERAHAEGLKYSFLETLSDIDTINDLQNAVQRQVICTPDLNPIPSHNYHSSFYGSNQEGIVT